MLPTFVVVGPGRSGTSWIYRALLEHPEVCMAKHTKETLFFDHEYYRGLAWYSTFFEHCENAKAIGEVSNTYTYDPEVPERMWNTIPSATLITCLRHPLERIRSVYLFRRRNGQINTDFEQAIQDHPDLIDHNRYWTQVSRLLEYFPEEQVAVLFYDRLRSRPEGFAQDLYRAVGVSEEFRPSVLDDKVNVSATPRIPGTGVAIKAVGMALRKVGLYAPLDWAKRHTIIQKLLFQSVSSSSVVDVMSLETQEYLLSLYEPEIEGIEQFTGQDLSHWKTVIE